MNVNRSGTAFPQQDEKPVVQSHVRFCHGESLENI